MRLRGLSELELRGLPIGLGVVTATWAAHQFTELIPTTACAALLVLALLLAMPLPTRLLATIAPSPASKSCFRSLLLMLALSIGFVGMTHWRAQLRLDERLLPSEEGQTIELIAMIDELPVEFDHGVRFGARVESCIAGLERCTVGSLYRLGWYAQRPRPNSRANTNSVTPVIKPGQRWQFELRLKRVHASANPGLFDAELRALEDGVAARGYVRNGRLLETPSLLSLLSRAPGAAIHAIRWHLREMMVLAMPQAQDTSRAVIVALVVGDQSGIAPTAWEMFNRTGIGHLISISGLHITMLAGIAHMLTTRVWRSARLHTLLRLPLAAVVPTPIAARVMAVITALAYSALAGWGIPAQRTCWMLVAALLASLSNRGASPLNIVAAALVVVLALDPWAVLAAGFWLSFAAVAAIVWFATGQRPGETTGRLVVSLLQAGRAQVAVSLALVPIGAVFFSSVSLISPLANTLAIPVVSFIVTPLALTGAAIVLALPALGAVVLSGACHVFEMLMVVMSILDRLEHAVWIVPLPDRFSLLLAGAGVLLFLSQLLPGRWAALITLLPILTAPPAKPHHPDEFWLTALDVGQGMAVLIETREARLLFDTGPRYSEDSDAGQRILAPYLRARGINRLERLVLSHRDSDHSGGAPGVWRSLRVDRLQTSMQLNDPLLAPARIKGIELDECARGDAWQWGGVTFEWLHPGVPRSASKRSLSNANSCVLRVSSAAGAALLTGDIEVAQEHELISRLPREKLQAETLIAPHHGSRTSSSGAFIEAVSPAQVIFQMGYRNRYRHPHPLVWQRYVNSGAELLRSDWHGAIEVRHRPGHAPLVRRYRLDMPRYWRVCAVPAGCQAAAMATVDTVELDSGQIEDISAKSEASGPE